MRIKIILYDTHDYNLVKTVNHPWRKFSYGKGEVLEKYKK